MISTARPFDATTQVPDVAAAFMGMGSFNILWIGLLVTVVAVTMNWSNSRLGYWLNLAVVGATDAGLVWALLAPGYMACCSRSLWCSPASHASRCGRSGQAFSHPDGGRSRRGGGLDEGRPLAST
jgi:hypothetical protein